MNNGKISANSFITIIPHLTTSAFLGTGTLYLFNKVKKSALITLLIGFIISIFIISIFFKVFNTFKDDTLDKKIKNIFPKSLYYTIIIIIALNLMICGTLLVFRLISFFNTQFLTDTSRYILTILLGLLIFYLSSKNIEVITRYSTITLFFLIIIFSFNFTSLTPYFDINNILPIINADYKSILLSSLIAGILFSGLSFLILVIPKNNITGAKKFKLKVIILYIFSALLLLAIFTFTLGCLGINITNIYTYPIYIVLKKIHVFKFVNSIENIVVLFGFFTLVVSSSISFIFFKDMIGNIFNIKNTKKRNIILFIVMFIFSFALELISPSISSLDKPIFVIIPLIVFIIFIIISIIYLIKYKLYIKNKKVL